MYVGGRTGGERCIGYILIQEKLLAAAVGPLGSCADFMDIPSMEHKSSVKLTHFG